MIVGSEPSMDDGMPDCIKGCLKVLLTGFILTLITGCVPFVPFIHGI